jgi:hypothetical protein
VGCFVSDQRAERFVAKQTVAGQDKPAHAFGNKFEAIVLAVFGLLVAFGSMLFPSPGLQDLTEVEGRLLSYSIEIAGGRSMREHVVFSIENRDGRFSTDSVKPHEAPTLLAFKGMLLKFHVAPPSWHQRSFGDAVKSYGMTINGVHIRSAESAFEERKLPRIEWFIGLILLGVAAYKWRKNSAEGA